MDWGKRLCGKLRTQLFEPAPMQTGNALTYSFSSTDHKSQVHNANFSRTEIVLNVSLL